MMKLISVNTGKPQKIRRGWKSINTGIFKQAVGGRVRVNRLNLKGDGQADLKVHGGEENAVYTYPHEYYAEWARELDRRDFTFGQFGEDFTVEGMLENQVCIGDVYRIGAALCQMSQPRVPCYMVALRMGMEDFPRRFMENRESPSASSRAARRCSIARTWRLWTTWSS